MNLGFLWTTVTALRGRRFPPEPNQPHWDTWLRDNPFHARQPVNNGTAIPVTHSELAQVFAASRGRTRYFDSVSGLFWIDTPFGYRFQRVPQYIVDTHA